MCYMGLNGVVNMGKEQKKEAARGLCLSRLGKALRHDMLCLFSCHFCPNCLPWLVVGRQLRRYKDTLHVNNKLTSIL